MAAAIEVAGYQAHPGIDVPEVRKFMVDVFMAQRWQPIDQRKQQNHRGRIDTKRPQQEVFL
jgi:hypothetical protein